MSRFIFLGPLLAFLLATLATSLWSGAAARTVLTLPDTPYHYADVELPAHFAQPGGSTDNTPVDNPITDAGATLGRVLFYDTILSANSKKACSSCHVQQ